MKSKKTKKIIVFLSIFALFFSLGCYSVHAEEVNTGENQVEEQQEKTVSIEVKWLEFVNKWMTPTVSAALGFAGSMIGYFLYKKKYRLVENAITSGVIKTEKARELANKELEKCKEELEKARLDYEKQKEASLALLNEMREGFNEFKQIIINDTTFKQLVAYLVSSTPELAKNGYASKILLLLDEGEKFVNSAKDILTDEKAGATDGTNDN